MFKRYASHYKDQVLSDWYDVSNAGISMREFCRDYDIPRSTLQGWLESEQRTEASETFNSVESKPLDKETLEVFRLLINELKAVTSDLHELVSKL